SQPSRRQHAVDASQVAQRPLGIRARDAGVEPLGSGRVTAARGANVGRAGGQRWDAAPASSRARRCPAAERQRSMQEVPHMASPRSERLAPLAEAILVRSAPLLLPVLGVALLLVAVRALPGGADASIVLLLLLAAAVV